MYNEEGPCGSDPWIVLQEKIDCLKTLGTDVRPVPAVAFTDPDNYNHQVGNLCHQLMLIGSMSPWVLPERTLGTVRYTETYPDNYLICRTVPCLLSTVPWLSLFHPLLMSQYLKYTCTDRQASYLYKVGLEYETVKPRRNFNLYTLMRAILLQISRWSGMRVSKLGTVWSRLGTVRHIR